MGKVLLGGKSWRGGPRRGRVQQHRHRVGIDVRQARSGLPSPLRSPSDTEMGQLPVVKFCWAAKLAWPPRRGRVQQHRHRVGIRLAPARSGLPSPLRSPTATDTGPVPVVKSCLAGKSWRGRPGAVVFNSTDTVLELVRHGQVGLAVAVEVPHRHGVRGRARGEGLAGRKGWRGRPGAVVFNSTDTVSESEFATARSGLPSPLRSPTATEYGAMPVAKSCLAAKAGAAAPGAVVFNSTDTVSEP